MPAHNKIMPLERIEGLIHLLRGQKVMLDFDLAALYGVETKALNQAVKRNLERFPGDFMFQLSAEEMNLLAHARSPVGASANSSQFVTSSARNSGKGPRTGDFRSGNWSQIVTSNQLMP